MQRQFKVKMLGSVSDWFFYEGGVSIKVMIQQVQLYNI